MTLRTFEDITVGETHTAGPLRVTREAIISFAEVYDPQPFHLDERAGAGTLLGGLAASGWHTCAMGMRLLHDGFVGAVAGMGAPGIDEVRWLKPVRAGDTLSMTLTVTSARPSASRDDRGFVGLAMDLADGRGEVVMTQRFTGILLRRGATQAPGAPAPPPSTLPVTVPAADPMLAAFLDEIDVGHETALGAQHFTADSIVGFASLYDPQPFHLDADAARRSHFGDLCASGWHTGANWMRHFVAARFRAIEARAAAGLPAADIGPSPGFSHMKWHRPVHVGRTIRYGLTVTGKRPVGRPGWGLISVTGTGRDDDDAPVFSFDGSILWPLSPSGR